MMRGDFVTIAVNGDYGKPRPALIVQDSAFAALPSLTVLQVTSDVSDEALIRITVDPTVENGLRKRSQIMVDRLMTVPRAKAGAAFGRLAPDVMTQVDRALCSFLGLNSYAPQAAASERDDFEFVV